MAKLIGIADGSIETPEEYTKQGKGLWYLKKSHSVTYQVKAPESEGSTEVLAVVPAIGTFQNGCRCNARSPKEVRTVFNTTTGAAEILWEVKCDFTNELTDEDGDGSQNPTNLRATFDWEGQEGEEVLDKDAFNGNPIQTKNGEPIIIMRPTFDPVLVVSRYETFPFNPEILLNFVGHTNLDTFFGAPRGSALMLPIEAPEEVVDNVRYCHVTYRICFRIKKDPNSGQLRQFTWDEEVLHQGFRYRDVAGGPIKTFLDAGSGNPAMVNLDDNGVKLGAADAPQYLRFGKFPEADFSTLNLGP